MPNLLNFIAPIATPVKENYTALKELLQTLGNSPEKFDNIGTVYGAQGMPYGPPYE